MKKHIIILFMALPMLAISQINIQSNTNSSISEQNPFLDASGYVANENSQGKGLYFPRTDLTQWEFKLDELGQYQFFPTAFDGMVVYNTGTGQTGNNASTQGVQVDVEPGFYYFSNPTATEDTDNVSAGKWIPFSPSSASGNFWSLDGNGGITEVVLDTNTGKITSGNFLGTKDEKDLVFATNSVPRLLIGKDGEIEENVGGEDFKFVLKVYGKAKFDKGIVTKASTYPDYVFDNYFTGKSEENPNYEFKSLSEVESFIKENNHLPGVTSIKELTKSGEGYDVDNTQMAIQTLEKVEELYLHIIEQQKEIKALKAEIAKLKK